MLNPHFFLKNIGYGMMLLNSKSGPDSYMITIKEDGHFWHEFLKKVYDKYLNKDSIVIDAGASSGLHTVYLSTICKTVHAFEPQTFVYWQLCANCFINSSYNVFTYNLALSNKEGNLDVSDENPGLDKNYNLNRFHLNYESIDSSGLKLVAKKDGYIKAVTLDSLDLGKIDFMKIDCETMDKLVILGAIETIKKYRPIIAFEAGDAFNDFFGNLNYKVEPIAGGNYLATPN